MEIVIDMLELLVEDVVRIESVVDFLEKLEEL
jgi:hypothetical protein